MTQTTSITQQCQLLTDLSHNYQSFSGAVNTNLLTELSGLSDCFIKDAEHAQNENRLLRIGIIGQIKRGKSSFLNSLLFNGKNVLPKAATPMTAALTKIIYAEKPKALIEFYSKNEWQNVVNVADAVITAEAVYQEQLQTFESNRHYEQNATRSAIRPFEPEVSDEQIACVELFSMMKASSIRIDDYLGKTISLDNVTSHNDLVNELNNYVGANGEFTPIVKSTELQLNINSLKNIEVVDTPGMNDPVISRGRKTQEFIGQCDVIFFLSNSGNFLDMHDMGLLAQNIPNKGVEDIILIGSRFDEVLLDACDNYACIGDLLENETHKLSVYAGKNVANVCRQHNSNQDESNEGINDDSGNENGIMQALQNALPPLFVSSMCYDLANKVSQESESLDEQEQLVLDNLNGMFDDFTFTDEDLADVANFDTVNEELNEIRTKKEVILAKRFDNLLAGSKNEIKHKLTQIEEDVSHKRKVLLEGDVESLAKKQQAIVKRIESGKAKVANIFEKYSIKAEKTLVAAKHEIQQDALQAKQVDSQSGSRQESERVCTGSERHGFLYLQKRNTYETRSYTVNFTYANVHESIAKLEEFILHTSKHLFDTSSKAISLDLFRQDIKNLVKDMFDFSDDDFDPDMILMPLSNAVERITISAINLDLDHHMNTIREQFNTSTVEGDEIANLRNEQSRVVALLLADIVKELERCTTTIVKKLAEEESKFVPSLTKDLIASVEQLKQDLAQKDQALATYEDILALVKTDLLALA